MVWNMTLRRQFVPLSRTLQLGSLAPNQVLQSSFNRCLSTSTLRLNQDEDTRRRFLPALMEFPFLAAPEFTHTIRNWFLTHVIIQPYFDPEFNLSEFKEGARRAVIEVSRCLSQGELEPLENLLTPECLKIVKENLSLFSMSQRQRLSLEPEDVTSSFIYQIGILMNDEEEENQSKRQERHVEITFVAHAVRGYEEVVESSSNLRDIKEKLDKRGGPLVVNFRFIREFTKGIEDQWTINALNYFFLKEATES